jgi:hypothetical protein
MIELRMRMSRVEAGSEPGEKQEQSTAATWKHNTGLKGAEQEQEQQSKTPSAPRYPCANREMKIATAKARAKARAKSKGIRKEMER